MTTYHVCVWECVYLSVLSSVGMSGGCFSSWTIFHLHICHILYHLIPPSLGLCLSLHLSLYPSISAHPTPSPFPSSLSASDSIHPHSGLVMVKTQNCLGGIKIKLLGIQCYKIKKLLVNFTFIFMLNNLSSFQCIQAGLYILSYRHVLMKSLKAYCSTWRNTWALQYRACPTWLICYYQHLYTVLASIWVMPKINFLTKVLVMIAKYTFHL